MCARVTNEPLYVRKRKLLVDVETQVSQLERDIRPEPLSGDPVQHIDIGSHDRVRGIDIADAFAGRSASARHARERQAPADQHATADRGDTVTVDAPESDEDSPVCFVIMPFTERDDRHAPGFFDEVLEQLLSPAATAAGFRVTTALRPGSDIIQSTIVNELLDADLVLCDLTEHNPNVLFELGLRVREEKPVVLVKARGTGRIFDVDHMLRVVEYDSNLWPSSVARDLPTIEEHIRATWENQDPDRTFIKILRQQSA